MVEIVAPEKCPCCGHMPAFVIRTCKQCGKEFRASRNQVLIGRAVVCGKACATKSKRGPRTELRERFMSKVAMSDSCWLWQGALSRGYGSLHTRGQPGPPSKLAHRVAYELFIGPIPEKMVVMHKCDTTGCVRPDHLALGSVADNLQDMYKKGRGRPFGRPKP